MRTLILISVAIGWLGAVEPAFATLFCAALKSPHGLRYGQSQASMRAFSPA